MIVRSGLRHSRCNRLVLLHMPVVKRVEGQAPAVVSAKACRAAAGDGRCLNPPAKWQPYWKSEASPGSRRKRSRAIGPRTQAPGITDLRIPSKTVALSLASLDVTEATRSKLRSPSRAPGERPREFAQVFWTELSVCSSCEAN